PVDHCRRSSFTLILANSISIGCGGEDGVRPGIREKKGEKKGSNRFSGLPGKSVRPLFPGPLFPETPDSRPDTDYALFWCERGDSNSHGLPHWILSPARLPVPPLSRRGASEPETIISAAGR